MDLNTSLDDVLCLCGHRGAAHCKGCDACPTMNHADGCEEVTPDTPPAADPQDLPAFEPGTFNFMELVSFDAKARWEGSANYAYDNWPWVLAEPHAHLADDRATFKLLRDRHRTAINAWWQPLSQEKAAQLNAHRAEADALARKAGDDA